MSAACDTEDDAAVTTQFRCYWRQAKSQKPSEALTSIVVHEVVESCEPTPSRTACLRTLRNALQELQERSLQSTAAAAAGAEPRKRLWRALHIPPAWADVARILVSVVVELGAERRSISPFEDRSIGADLQQACLCLQEFVRTTCRRAPLASVRHAFFWLLREVITLNVDNLCIRAAAQRSSVLGALLKYLRRSTAMSVIVEQGLLSILQLCSVIPERTASESQDAAAAAAAAASSAASQPAPPATLADVVRCHLEPLILLLQDLFSSDELSDEVTDTGSALLYQLVQLDLVADVLALEGSFGSDVHIFDSLLRDAFKYLDRANTAPGLLVFLDEVTTHRDRAAALQAMDEYHPHWRAVAAATHAATVDPRVTLAITRLLQPPPGLMLPAMAAAPAAVGVFVAPPRRAFAIPDAVARAALALDEADVEDWEAGTEQSEDTSESAGGL